MHHIFRKQNEEDAVYLDLASDLEESAGLGTSAPAGHQSRGAGLQPVAAPALRGRRADAATSTSNLTVPPPPPGPETGLGADQRRSVRDVFATEALDPQLRADLTQQLRGLLGNCDDSAIQRSVSEN